MDSELVDTAAEFSFSGAMDQAGEALGAALDELDDDAPIEDSAVPDVDDAPEPETSHEADTETRTAPVEEVEAKDEEAPAEDTYLADLESKWTSEQDKYAAERQKAETPPQAPAPPTVYQTPPPPAAPAPQPTMDLPPGVSESDLTDVELHLYKQMQATKNLQQELQGFRQQEERRQQRAAEDGWISDRQGSAQKAMGDKRYKDLFTGSMGDYGKAMVEQSLWQANARGNLEPAELVVARVAKAAADLKRSFMAELVGNKAAQAQKGSSTGGRARTQSPRGSTGRRSKAQVESDWNNVGVTTRRVEEKLFG